MANRYKIIGEKTCERAMHCMIFRNSVESAFCVTFEADITHFLKKIKKQGYSFTLAILFSKEKDLDFIELSATEEGYPLYKKLGFKEYKTPYGPMRFNF